MPPIDIAAVLARTPKLDITEATTEADASAAFPRLAPFNQGGIFAGRFSGETPWACHPGGDELLYILDGVVEVTVLGDSGAEVTTARRGQIVVVPQGSWHKQRPLPEVTLLTATPTPSRISDAADPRQVAASQAAPTR